MFSEYFFLFLYCFAIHQLPGNAISRRDQSENLMSDMDRALHLLTSAKISFTKYMMLTKTMNPRRPIDCEEILRGGHNRTGIYTIWPRSRLIEDKPLDVFCDMHTDGGGWTVLQRRGDYKRPIDYFNKNWESYKKGFGDIDKEFWLGNDNIFALTNQRAYSVRFDMMSYLGVQKYAVYDSFWIDDEDHKYTLHIQDYSGDAGDSMIKQHNNMNFTTYDQDNDTDDGHNCGLVFKAGWWFSSCFDVLLNGLNHRDIHEASVGGVNWNTWTGTTESLLETDIKIRPKDFLKINEV